MPVNALRKLLRRAWHGDPVALDECARTLVPALILETRLQLRDADLWRNSPRHALPRKLLKQALAALEASQGTPSGDGIMRVIRRLIENRARAHAPAPARRPGVTRIASAGRE